jgi:hypothetical protein
MKQIINGKMYNTETAKKLAYYCNIPNIRDFSHYRETLYKKKTGEYFLHGEGGAMTKYSKTVGLNEWSSGEKIMPMTIEKAKKWAEKYLYADEYEKIFGVVEE